jgi:hypothetical protein
MMEGFDAFVARINLRYAEARACLDRGDYVEAHRILARITQSHAKTSVSLRNVLIKQGKLEE